MKHFCHPDFVYPANPGAKATERKTVLFSSPLLTSGKNGWGRGGGGGRHPGHPHPFYSSLKVARERKKLGSQDPLSLDLRC